MKQERFLFYTEWRKRLDLLSDKQLRIFINSLIDYAEGKEVNIPQEDPMLKMAWYGIEKSLGLNKQKYLNRVEANKKNSKLGGAPAGNKNANKEKTTENNPN